MYPITELCQECRVVLHYLHSRKRSLFASLFCLPTSVFALLFVFLLAYNGFFVFYIHIPFPAKPSPEPANFSPENLAGESLQKWPSPSSPPLTKLSSSSSMMYAVKEENPPPILKTNLLLLHKSKFSAIPMKNSFEFKPKGVHRHGAMLKLLRLKAKPRRFSRKVKAFLENSSCKFRFFMTWISSIESFGSRESLSIESLFKSHPNACLVIVSNSLDSRKGSLILRPFLQKGIKLIAISPDFDYIFKNTHAEIWFNRLKRGNVDPGEVSLGQNLSNLLRLALLYKFGGIYIDTDVIVLKSFGNLRNVIGAQTIDPQTRNWSRLNNAVMIFDKNHPLLFKFIQEFALTFNGNKWGHNGPYLVSRVAARVATRPGFNFSVLPPSAFYPVDWTRIQSFFQGPRSEDHSKWVDSKLKVLHRQSFAVHLWNRQSKKLVIQEGSIIDSIMSDCCIFCNSSGSELVSLQ